MVKNRCVEKMWHGLPLPQGERLMIGRGRISLNPASYVSFWVSGGHRRFLEELLLLRIEFRKKIA